MLIGSEHSSLPTDLAVPLHLQPSPLSTTFHLSIPSSNGRATVAADKEESCCKPGEAGQRRGERERGRAREEGGWVGGEGGIRWAKEKGNVSPSAEQKNGVCESCERGEIAFSFHFTRLPFLVQPSSFTSRPLLRTGSHKQTGRAGVREHTHTHTCA